MLKPKLPLNGCCRCGFYCFVLRLLLIFESNVLLEFMLALVFPDIVVTAVNFRFEVCVRLLIFAFVFKLGFGLKYALQPLAVAVEVELERKFEVGVNPVATVPLQLRLVLKIIFFLEFMLTLISRYMFTL